MLTLKDLLKIEKIVFEQLQAKFQEAFKFLPSKDDFFGRMDDLTKEIKAMRETQELHQHDHDRVDKRLRVVEKHLHLPSVVD